MLRAERNLRKKQKSLSRKVKGSRNREKAKLLVAKAYEKLTNARHDFQHKLSKRIVDKNQALIFEKLKSSNMMKNGKLAKHIGDAAWFSLSGMSNSARDRNAGMNIRLAGVIDLKAEGFTVSA